MTPQEQHLERNIEGAYDCLINAKTRNGRLLAMALMTSLVGRRSPKRIAAMEREKGLVR